ncbi:DUF262 domain-containing protein [Providencia sp. PROV216]|uniref:DUF262 domain-containing protein n=1 Tax=Providencia sp. PROV216 TaxID=2949912 RepID=UPI00234B356B|nr:DUF262 domain-containing protein [Providencia sp. PROV216]
MNHEEELFSNNDDDSYPLDEFRLTTTPNDFNIMTIISFIESGVFKIPAFQRHFVWDIKRASKLIESLLIGLPIPQVFLYEQGKNQYLVIDGQQRLMSIYYFSKGRFPKKEKRSELREIFELHGKIPQDILSDDTYFSKFNLKLDGPTDNQKNKFSGLNYDTLDEYQMNLNLSTIRNMFIKPSSEEDDENGAMFEIFNRLNSGGVNLSTQEIRMSLFHSPFLSCLVELNNNPVWRRLLGKPEVDIRLNDVEAILRVYSMVFYSENYKNKVAGFLNAFANKSKKLDEDVICLSRDIWAKFMDNISSIPNESFRLGGTKLSITLFESIFYALTKDAVEQCDPSIVGTISDSFIANLKADQTFISFSTGKTTRKESVLGRLRVAKEIYSRS